MIHVTKNALNRGGNQGKGGIAGNVLCTNLTTCILAHSRRKGNENLCLEKKTI